MEIHYFWIDFNNIIKGQPITLSSRYIFTTEIDNRTKTGKITIIDNPEFIENFFEKPNIKNISVIVGKNGAGKTSIFNYILETFPRGLSPIVQNNLVIYTQQDSNELHIVKPENWKVKIINKTNQIYKITSSSLDLNAIDFFYYNFFLDYKIEVHNWAGIKNLSTSTLLCLPRKKAIEERWRDKIDPTEAKIFDLDFFIKDEISKAIQLLISDKKALIPFSTPEELYITISTNDYKYFRDTTTKKETVEINSIVSLLLEKFKQINDATEDIEKKLLNNLYIGLFINFLVTHYYYSSYIIPLNPDVYFSFNANYSIRDYVLSFFEKLKKEKIDIEGVGPGTITSFEKLGVIVPEFIKMVENFVNNQTFTFDPYNPYHFMLPLTQETDRDFTKFFKLYLQIKGLTHFLEFNWPGLSTGQQSFLSFMSRFYHEQNHAIGNDQIKKNLFIMIDEGDAGFHPEWKKQFFHKSLNFLSDLFSDKNIQLVYTSNSPYILSDLPKNHITFIENMVEITKETTGKVKDKIDTSKLESLIDKAFNKDDLKQKLTEFGFKEKQIELILSHANKENEIKILEKNNSFKETFAQNIHTLLSNSFFLENGLIGDFAKKKINKAIELINKENNTTEEIAQIKNIIKIIGEPVIKQKLNQLFEDKFGFSIDIDIKQEIEYLERRLSKLKQNLKKIENND